MNWQTIIIDLFTYGFLAYSILLLSCYIFIGAYSIGEIRIHLYKNSFTDYRQLASASQAPGMSILAPAYNEGANVIENVRSLLSIHYANLEVIIINDGSRTTRFQN